MKASIHTASHIDTQLGLAGLGLGFRLGLASQASRVYISRMAIHTTTGEASPVYGMSQKIDADDDNLLHLQSPLRVEIPKCACGVRPPT